MARTLPELGAAVVAFLNGLTHHLMAERSDPERYEYARIGYELAPKFDPNNWLAAQQLGRPSLSLGDYEGTRENFAHPRFTGRAIPRSCSGSRRLPIIWRHGNGVRRDQPGPRTAAHRA
jgi:hypothetical protein